MIANLMMYQRPELMGAHDRFWGLIRRHLIAAGIDAPKKLSQDAEEFRVWKDPDLVLSMTCGMPYRLWLHDRVELVGTLDYGLNDCAAGYYRSAIVVRADDPRTDIAAFRDRVFAYNQTFSQSGYGAMYFHTKPHGFFFEKQFQTGAHLGSARVVVDGQADIASIDGVTWRNAAKYEPFVDQLRVLEWTTPTPGLPLITGPKNDPQVVFDTVGKAIEELGVGDCAALGIRGIVKIEKSEYLAIPNPPQAP